MADEIVISLKIQDRLREWFSKRGSLENVQISCISLGDSDIDYELSTQYSKIKTIPSAYQIPRIKYKLIYSGGLGGVTGIITSYLRRINGSGQAEALYHYPANTNFYVGDYPPTVVNGYDWSLITFDELLSAKEGFIILLQTLPDNYFDENNKPLRLVEQYDILYNEIPSSWEIIEDSDNGSFLIAKPDGYVFQGFSGVIEIKGRDSGIQKFLTFNY